ncbi:MAG: serine hydrolase [Saprospiraceae bacterium]
MKKIIILILHLILMLTSFFAQSQEAIKLKSFTSISDKANAVLQECINFNEMVGVTSGIYKDGKVVWEGGVGYQDMENNIAAKSNTLHRTASIAKPMTAIAILQLYEQNKLKLDVPIQQYLPDFPKKEKAITIRQLLQHTSGIKAYQTNQEADNTKNYPTLTDAMTVFKDRDLNHQPGTNYHYTTYGYVVLGAIVEHVSGMSFRDYMKQKIWEKIGMKNTDVEIFGKEYINKSKLYRKNSSGKFITDIQTDLSVKIPGGGFYSTVNDLLKFGAAILDNKLISAATFEMMIKDSGLKKRGNPYGMGWFIYGKSNDASGKLIGHSGSQSGTSTQLMIYLDKKIVVATMSNTAGTWPEVISLTSNLGEISIDSAVMQSPLKKVSMVPIEVLEKYIGKYQLDEEESMTLTRKGKQLFASFNGSSNYKVFAESENKFFLRSLNLTFEFEKSSQKNITKMIFTTLKGKKIYPEKINAPKSFALSLNNHIEEKGITASLEWWEQIKNSKEYNHNEEEINALGYEYLQAKNVNISIQIFNLNVIAFPDSWNAYDSLGEAFMLDGNKEMAIKNYKKSVELNPKNTYGLEALKKLGVKMNSK